MDRSGSLGGSVNQLGRKALAEVSEVFRHHAARCRGGMQFSVYRNGESLLRLFSGRAGDMASPRAWDDDTLTVIFSGTKGLTALVAARAVDKGLLEVDAPIARYWPEFVVHGKNRATVAQVLSHTVGLPVVETSEVSSVTDNPAPDHPIADNPIMDNATMAHLLAGQTPLWEPGTDIAYHPLTYGYLMSEIIRRATGRTIGDWLRKDLPRRLDLHLGLATGDEARVAPIVRAPGFRIAPQVSSEDNRRVMIERMYAGVFADSRTVNSRAFHSAELSAAGGLATADALAELYSLLVTPGRPGGGIVSAAALRAATEARAEGIDRYTGSRLCFGLGFELADDLGTYGPDPYAFGHSGAGGGIHGAWPESGIGFSFLTNEMRPADTDTRGHDLLAALGEAV